MTKIDDGGPAFPTPENKYGEYTTGLSLRDWFSGQALAGLCGNPGGPYQAKENVSGQIVNCMPINIAEEAYHLADAMIEARKRHAAKPD